MLWRRLCGEGPCRHPALGQPPRAPSRRPPARSPGSGVSEQPGPLSSRPGDIPAAYTHARTHTHTCTCRCPQQLAFSQDSPTLYTHTYIMSTASVGAGPPGGGLLRASGQVTAAAHLTCCRSSSDLSPVLTGRPWCCLQGCTVGTCGPWSGGSPCPQHPWGLWPPGTGASQTHLVVSQQSCVLTRVPLRHLWASLSPLPIPLSGCFSIHFVPGNQKTPRENHRQKHQLYLSQGPQTYRPT